MKSSPAPTPRFRLATYLDGVLFWAVFASTSVLMLWLLTSTTRQLLRESVAARAITLSNMTAASLSPQLYEQDKDQEEELPLRSFSDIPSEHLQAIQDQNPDLAGVLVVNIRDNRLNILTRTKTSGPEAKAFLEDSRGIDFLNYVRQAQKSVTPLFSTWSFLTSNEMPLFVKRVHDPEYTFTAIPKWRASTADEIPVIILIFKAELLQRQFLRIDDNSAAVVAVAVLMATILGWLVHWRSTQRQQAVEEKLAALTLLRQRDAILGRVASATDEVLANKNFEQAIVRMLKEINRELNLKACYVCLASASDKAFLGAEDSGSGLVTWPDIDGGVLAPHLPSLSEGRIVTLLPDSAAKEEIAFLQSLYTRSLALIPILFEKRLLGAIVLLAEEAEQSWDPGLLDSLKLAADFYGAAYGRREHDNKLLESSKIQALGRMAGGVAHEFNNLLHIISGNLERLQQQSSLSLDKKELITKILEATGRGGRIVEQLLSATRQSSSDRSPVSLNELVQKTVSLFQPVAKSDIDLEMILDPELPTTLLDSAKIQQVLLNLLLNANDATASHGKIQLLTSCRERLVDGESRSFVCCEVRDNGSGIREEDLKHIFDPFFTTKPPGQGTGLGLSTSRGIMIQHGGFMEAHNQMGGGAVVAFYAPVHPGLFLPQEQKKTSGNILPKDKKPGPRGRVLMADDEPLCREVMAAILDEQGYVYEAARDGEELLKLARLAKDEVMWVITDWTMPGCHGVELVQELRKILPHARIIVTSGFALSSLDIPEVDALIQKPFGPDELFRVMGDLEQNPAS